MVLIMRETRLDIINENLDQIEELAKSICKIDDEEVKEIQLETIKFRIRMIKEDLEELKKKS